MWTFSLHSFPITHAFAGCLNFLKHLHLTKEGASLVVHMVKSLPAVQETMVRFLGWEDPLEKGLATHSIILGLPLWLS